MITIFLFYREILLNDRVLVMPSDNALPRFTPLEIPSGYLVFKPYSIVFWVLPQAGATICN